MTATLYTDGGSRGNPGPSAIACVLFDADMHLLSYNGKFTGVLTNNQAEYRALRLGVELAAKNGVTELFCRLDSELVVKQMRGEYKIKDENIKQAIITIKEATESFKKVEYTHVPRAENHLADKLVNIILDAREA